MSPTCRIRWPSTWSGVCHSLSLSLFGARCLGPLGNWRFQVNLSSGPSILQAPGERSPFGWILLPGLPWITPFRLMASAPCQPFSTSSQAHQFVMSLNLAKFDLSKVRLKPVQSVVSPFTARDLPNSPLETCRTTVSLCITRAVLLADRCR